METKIFNSTPTPIGEGMQIFNSEAFGAIRTAGTPDEPLFCLSDICRILELQAGAVKNRLGEKGISFINTPTQGGVQQLTYINEQNLYKVIMRSNKPQAEAFQDWVCGEVLPSIRKSGGYIAAQVDETPEQIMARALKVADETLKRQKIMLQAKDDQIEAQTAEIKELAPLADYTREVLQSDSTYTFTQMSKDLGFRSVYTFTDWLFGKKLIYRQSGQWLPTSHVSEAGYFATRTHKFVKSDNTIGTSISTVITEKGRQYLHELSNKAQESCEKGATL